MSNGIYWKVQVAGNANPILLGSDSVNFGPTQNTLTEIIQNVQTILTTNKGSVTLFRDFGIDYSFLDYPMNVAQNMIVAEVINKVPKYEPRCSIKQCQFSGDESGLTGKMSVLVIININLKGPAPSLVLGGAPGVLKTVIDVSTGVAVVEKEVVSS